MYSFEVHIIDTMTHCVASKEVEILFTCSIFFYASCLTTLQIWHNFRLQHVWHPLSISHGVVAWWPLYHDYQYFKFEFPFSIEIWCVSFPMNVCVDTLMSKTITFSWGLARAPLSPPSSRQNPSDLQYWDEKQDEGAHHDGRCYFLEVDLP